jgi:SAM-dependent methyltransferase
MQRSRDLLGKRLEKDLIVLDVGGRDIKANQDRSYRSIFGDVVKEYYIADIQSGANVTHVMTGEYELPFEDNSIDLVVSGQTLEHVKNPFRSVIEMTRVLKPGGYIILIAPSSGKRHDFRDCWRFMDDAFSAIAEEAELETIVDYVDREAPDERSQRWNDHVFVGRKPE